MGVIQAVCFIFILELILVTYSYGLCDQCICRNRKVICRQQPVFTLLRGEIIRHRTYPTIQALDFRLCRLGYLNMNLVLKVFPKPTLIDIRNTDINCDLLTFEQSGDLELKTDCQQPTRRDNVESSIPQFTTVESNVPQFTTVESSIPKFTTTVLSTSSTLKSRLNMKTVTVRVTSTTFTSAYTSRTTTLKTVHTSMSSNTDIPTTLPVVTGELKPIWWGWIFIPCAGLTIFIVIATSCVIMRKRRRAARENQDNRGIDVLELQEQLGRLRYHSPPVSENSSDV